MAKVANGPGDLNGDGIVDEKDEAIAKRYQELHSNGEFRYHLMINTLYMYGLMHYQTILQDLAMM